MDHHQALDEPARISISRPTELLAAVPVLLGFHPTESLVVVAIAGRRWRLGPVARIDLPSRVDRVRVVDQLIGTVRPHADRVALIGYSSDRSAPATLRSLRRRARAVGLPVLDCLLVDGPRAVRMGEAGVAEPVDLPAPDDAISMALTGAAALAGRAILPSRPDLAASIAGPSGALAAASELSVRTALDELGGRLGGIAPDPSEREVDLAITDIALRTAREAADGYAGQHTVALESTARLAAVMFSKRARDEVIAEVLSDQVTPWVPILVGICAQLSDESAAAAAAVLAVAAYRAGDGALAQVAIDRCLRAEPGYEMGRLLALAFAVGIRPEELDELGEAVRQDRADHP